MNVLDDSLETGGVLDIQRLLLLHLLRRCPHVDAIQPVCFGVFLHLEQTAIANPGCGRASVNCLLLRRQGEEFLVHLHRFVHQRLRHSMVDPLKNNKKNKTKTIQITLSCCVDEFCISRASQQFRSPYDAVSMKLAARNFEMETKTMQITP